MGEDASALATSKKGRKGGILLQIKKYLNRDARDPACGKTKIFCVNFTLCQRMELRDSLVHDIIPKWWNKGQQHHSRVAGRHLRTVIKMS